MLARTTFACIAAVLVAGLDNYLPAAVGARAQDAPMNIASSPITPAEDTTVFLGPLDSDGMVDYVAALDREMSKGITEANNAALLIVRALGPKFFDDSTRPEALKQLGLRDLGPEKDWFRGLDQYIPDKETRDAQLKAVTSGAWTPQDYPQVHQWLTANEASLRMLGQASMLPRFFIPIVIPPDCYGLMSYQEPNFRLLRKAAVPALLARAFLCQPEGSGPNGFADILTVHRLARLVAQGPTVIYSLTALGLEASACETALDLAEVEGLSDDEIRTYLKAIDQLAPLPGVQGKIDQFERCRLLEFVFILAHSGPKALEDFLASADHEATFRKTGNASGAEGLTRGASGCPYDYDFDAMLRMVNKHVDMMTKAWGGETFAARARRLEAFDQYMHQLASQANAECARIVSPPKNEGFQLFSLLAEKCRAVESQKQRDADKGTPSDLTARLLISIVYPNLSGLNAVEAKTATRLEVVRAVLALKLYKAKHGAYPKSLPDLTPGLLKAVPKDPFTEMPLSYKLDGDSCEIRSLGPDGWHDGYRTLNATGDDDSKRPDGDDIVEKIQ